MEQKRLKQNKGKNSEHNTTQNINMRVEPGRVIAVGLHRGDHRWKERQAGRVSSRLGRGKQEDLLDESLRESLRLGDMSITNRLFDG
jgi:hypothetical protein